MVALTMALFVALFLVFSAYSLAQTADGWAFWAGVPLVLWTAAVLCGWASLIRLDASAEREDTAPVPRSSVAAQARTTDAAPKAEPRELEPASAR